MCTFLNGNGWLLRETDVFSDKRNATDALSAEDEIRTLWTFRWQMSLNWTKNERMIEWGCCLWRMFPVRSLKWGRDVVILEPLIEKFTSKPAIISILYSSSTHTHTHIYIYSIEPCDVTTRREGREEMAEKWKWEENYSRSQFLHHYYGSKQGSFFTFNLFFILC